MSSEYFQFQVLEKLWKVRLVLFLKLLHEHFEKVFVMGIILIGNRVKSRPWDVTLEVTKISYLKLELNRLPDICWDAEIKYSKYFISKKREWP